VHAAGYVETAVAVHRSYLEGKLAPEIELDSPAFVTAWFAGKVPFDFRLPADRGGNPLQLGWRQAVVQALPSRFSVCR
jgi:hypothetical protein